MIKKVIEIAKEAGEKIMEIYEKDFQIEYKEDSSPLTEADLAANEIIVRRLKEISNYPILSEESAKISYEERKKWSKFWMVDPIDGTKEFIKKNGEFTVNIALIEDKKPILGVVYVPAKNDTYYADENGSFKNDIKLPVEEKHEKLIIVSSRSHLSEETKEYLESLGKEYELIQSGSSIKLCLVAEGKADLYPRLGPTMEWDTGAAHAVCRFAGKKVLQYNSDKELEYNKEDLHNPHFIVK